jgi:hypothetical protein
MQRSDRPAPRCRGDRGAALAETAITFPVFFLLIVGIFEFGLVYRDNHTVGNAVGDAVRIGGVQGPDFRVVAGAEVTADYSIVATVRSATASIPPSWIDRIVVFKATSPAQDPGPAIDQVPDSCKVSAGSSTANECNVYPGTESLYNVQIGNIDYFNCAEGGTRACGWDPLGRDDGPALDEIDYLGVYVKLNREMLTGVFGDDFQIEQAAIIRLEPGTVEET